jgi:hypothetical protein
MKFVTVPVRRDKCSREKGLDDFSASRKSTKVHEQQFTSLLSTTFHNSLYQISNHGIQFTWLYPHFITHEEARTASLSMFLKL